MLQGGGYITGLLHASSSSTTGLLHTPSSLVRNTLGTQGITGLLHTPSSLHCFPLPLPPPLPPLPPPPHGQKHGFVTTSSEQRVRVCKVWSGQRGKSKRVAGGRPRLSEHWSALSVQAILSKVFPKEIILCADYFTWEIVFLPLERAFRADHLRILRKGFTWELIFFLSVTLISYVGNYFLKNNK